MKNLTKSLLLVSVLGLSQGANAEGFSIGLMAGQSDFDDFSSTCDGINNDGFSIPGLNLTCDADTSDTSVGVNIAYDFPLGFGIEGGYVDLGEFVTTITGTATPDFSFSDEVSTELSAIYGAGKYTLELGNNFGLTGRLGYYDPSADIVSSDLSEEVEGDADVYYGISADYKITDNLTGQLRYDNFDLDVFSLGISYRFGR